MAQVKPAQASAGISPRTALAGSASLGTLQSASPAAVASVAENAERQGAGMDRFANNSNPWSKGAVNDLLEDIDGLETPVVCILANVRRGPYWIDVATSATAMESLARNHTLRRRMKGEAVSESDAVLPVWYAACECMAEAERRAEDLRRWSPLWQRSLIERSNPQWLDLGAMAIGFPVAWVTALPEKHGMPHRAVSAL